MKLTKETDKNHPTASYTTYVPTNLVIQTKYGRLLSIQPCIILCNVRSEFKTDLRVPIHIQNMEIVSMKSVLCCVVPLFSYVYRHINDSIEFTFTLYLLAILLASSYCTNCYIQSVFICAWGWWNSSHASFLLSLFYFNFTPYSWHGNVQKNIYRHRTFIG